MSLRVLIVFAFSLVAAIAASIPAFSLEPVRPGQDTFIRSAIFAGNQLWLLTDAGMLFTVAEGREDRVDMPLPEPALDLWRQAGHPAVITCQLGSCNVWTIRELIDGEWKELASVPAEGDGFVAIRADGAALVLLTSRRIIEIAGERQNVTMLSSPIQAPGQRTVHATAENIFVGLNAGEWGGGMRRIGRKTGAVTVIERNKSGALCGGPLNTQCDPVTGIATEPWKPDCVAAAVGLVHFLPHGRVVEVCGDEVRRLYVKPYGQQRPDNEKTRQYGRGDGEPRSSVAFFGLAQSGSTLLAIGIDGIYEIRPDGTAQMNPLPAFKEIAGVSVSFENPATILVRTNINQRLSLSGSVPILVPR